MVQNKFYTSRKIIERWLKNHDIRNYTINEDLSVDCYDSVDIRFKRLMIDYITMARSYRMTALRVKFNKVSGNFACNSNNLTSLDFAPSHVGGSFHCYNNKLTSLHNIHKTIKHCQNFICFNNPITSNILGLCLIKGLKAVDINFEINGIINSNLHDINLCQEALLDAGYPELAKL